MEKPKLYSQSRSPGVLFSTKNQYIFLKKGINTKHLLRQSLIESYELELCKEHSNETCQLTEVICSRLIIITTFLIAQSLFERSSSLIKWHLKLWI